MVRAQERSDKQVLLDDICGALALLQKEGLLSSMLMHALASETAAALGALVRASCGDSRPATSKSDSAPVRIAGKVVSVRMM